MRFEQNDCRTPRERVDGEMAARMMKECGCGSMPDSGRAPIARGEGCIPAPVPTPTPPQGCACRRPIAGQAQPRGARGCGAVRSAWGLDGYPLAMVYAPSQRFSDIDCPEKGLAAGTIFRELALPFVGKGCRGGM